MKLGMYIQSDSAKNQTAFDKIMKQVKASGVDVVIMQAGAYVPFAPVYKNGDILKSENQQKILGACSDLSDRLGKAVVVYGADKHGSEFVIFANSAADFGVGEENAVFYLRHIGAGKSAYEMDEYRELAYQMLYPLLFKGLRFGLLAGDDVEYSAYSRIYGKEGMDLLITLADGTETSDILTHVRARAVENSAVSLVLGAGEGAYAKAYGPDGSELITETPWDGFVTCEISDDPITDNGPKSEKASEEDEEAASDFIKANNGENVAPGIWKIASENGAVIALNLKDEELLIPEKVLPLVYSGETDEIENRRFLISASVNKDMSDYNKDAIVDLIKSRAIENHCAVVYESADEKLCYLPQEDGSVAVKALAELDMAADLESYKGALDIWENDAKLKEEWLDDYTWLIELIQKQIKK